MVLEQAKVTGFRPKRKTRLIVKLNRSEFYCDVSENSLNLGRGLETPGVVMTDRRRSSRFPIEREVRYKTLNQRSEVLIGIGKTLNISSSGVLFTSDHELPLGTRLEVSISWPAQLNEKCMLNLVARGRVARYLKGQVAVQIQQYEFRTQSRSGQ
jgi:PilZ domain